MSDRIGQVLFLEVLMFRSPTLWRLSLRAALLLVCALACQGCYNLYGLPAPPPQEKWTNASLEPGQDEINQEKIYIEARSAALKLYSELSAGDWDASWEMFSGETQNFLSYAHPEKDGKAALAQGQLQVPGEDPVSIDPVDFFLIQDLRRLEDEHPDFPQEAETPNRKELYAISADDQVHKVVLIREENAWRVHKTSVE
jgi:hypothetical protein